MTTATAPQTTVNNPDPRLELTKDGELIVIRLAHRS
jgi:hypothetical protein